MRNACWPMSMHIILGICRAVSFPALALTAIPAATGLAREAVDVGGRMGQGFLAILSNMSASSATDTSTGSTDAAHEASGPNPPATNSSGEPLAPLASKTKAWCEKLMSWLGQNQSKGDVNIELSLDSLDQPQAIVTGEGSEKLSAAIADNPVWLQEFRELALDRAREQGRPPLGAPQAQPPKLSISQPDGQLIAAWE